MEWPITEIILHLLVLLLLFFPPAFSLYCSASKRKKEIIAEPGRPIFRPTQFLGSLLIQILDVEDGQIGSELPHFSCPILTTSSHLQHR